MCIVHAWVDYAGRKVGDIRRHKTAYNSWQRAYAIGEFRECRLHESNFRRTAKTAMGGTKSVPFIRDVLDEAMHFAMDNRCETILFSNDDVSFAGEMGDAIASRSMGWASRRDFVTAPRILTRETIANGSPHSGMDAFWLPTHRWNTLREEMPDMVLGFELWDYVMRELLREHGGEEIKDLLAHENHTRYWEANPNAPAAKHNNTLGRAFLEKRGINLFA